MGYFSRRLCDGRQPNRRSGESATIVGRAKAAVDKRQCLVASIIDAPAGKNLEHSLTGGAEGELS